MFIVKHLKQIKLKKKYENSKLPTTKNKLQVESA